MASILGIGGRDPPDFGLGGCGRMGVLGGCERVSENTTAYCALFRIFYTQKREKFAKHVGVKGETVNIFGEKTRSSEFLPGKSEIFLENLKKIRLESKISATGFTTPQTSNQIDAADFHGRTPVRMRNHLTTNAHSKPRTHCSRDAING